MRSGALNRVEKLPLDADRNSPQQTFIKTSESAEGTVVLRTEAEPEALDPSIAAYELLIDRLCRKGV